MNRKTRSDFNVYLCSSIGLVGMVLFCGCHKAGVPAISLTKQTPGRLHDAEPNQKTVDLALNIDKQTSEVDRRESAIKEMITLLVSHPSLVAFYHPEVEGRTPVAVVCSGLEANDLGLRELGGVSFSFQQSPNEGQKPKNTVFIEREGGDHKTRLLFRYEVEGLKGHGDFGIDDSGATKLINFVIAEH